MDPVILVKPNQLNDHSHWYIKDQRTDVYRRIATWRLHEGDAWSLHAAGYVPGLATCSPDEVMERIKTASERVGLVSFTLARGTVRLLLEQALRKVHMRHLIERCGAQLNMAAVLPMLAYLCWWHPPTGIVLAAGIYLALFLVCIMVQFGLFYWSKTPTCVPTAPPDAGPPYR